MSEIEKRGRGRPKKETVEFVMPSSPSDIQKINDSIKEADGSLIRVAYERDLFKSIAERMEEELGMPKKLFNKMAKTYHKQNYDKEVAEHETFEEIYDRVVNNKSSKPLDTDEADNLDMDEE